MASVKQLLTVATLVAAVLSGATAAAAAAGPSSASSPGTKDVTPTAPKCKADEDLTKVKIYRATDRKPSGKTASVCVKSGGNLCEYEVTGPCPPAQPGLPYGSTCGEIDYDSHDHGCIENVAPTQAPTSATYPPAPTLPPPSSSPVDIPACNGGTCCVALPRAASIITPSGLFQDWAIKARVGPSYLTSYDGKIDEGSIAVVKKLQEQSVSVVELDTEYSYYMDDKTYAELVQSTKEVATYVHTQGLKIVVYFPAGEVITKQATNVNKGKTIYDHHPDWVQLDLDGKTPNVFYGTKVFWIEKDEQSAWMNFNSGYKEYFSKRVVALASAGVDGVWMDVPLYNEIISLWTDASPTAAQAFTAETGLTIPKKADWNDKNFRVWLSWRHKNINKFITDVCTAARAVNLSFLCIIETVTMDYYYAMRAGLDGAALLADGVTHVWEVDVVSLDNSMRTAFEDDWISLIGMYKYARSASSPYPAWAFSYGAKEDDARHVMAVVLATGCNVYEVKSPKKEGSVDPAMRAKMYAWIKTHEDRLYRASSIAKVGVFHSSESRDYVVGPSVGSGLLCSLKPPAADKTWWAKDTEDSCYTKEWLGEYRGVMKALLHAHIPFDVISSPRMSTNSLSQYSTIYLPNTQAVTDEQASAFRDFVTKGGNLVVTGPKPAALDNFGTARTELAISDILGFGKASIPSTNVNVVNGGGKVFYLRDYPGWRYLNKTSDTAAQISLSSLAGVSLSFFKTDADRRTHFEAKTLEAWNEVHLHMINYIGLNGKYQKVKTSFKVDIDLALLSAALPKKPSAFNIQEVAVISPDTSFSCPTGDVGYTPAFTFSQSSLSVSIKDLDMYSVLVIKYAA